MQPSLNKKIRQLEMTGEPFRNTKLLFFSPLMLTGVLSRYFCRHNVYTVFKEMTLVLSFLDILITQSAVTPSKKNHNLLFANMY